MDKGKEIVNEPFWMHPDNEKEIIGDNKMNGIYIKSISMPNGGTLKIEIGYDADGHPMALTENHDVFGVVPAADVRPVVRGSWVDEPIKGIRYHCSVCQGRFDYTWRFCPNCGADMRNLQSDSANANNSEGIANKEEN